MRDLTEHFLKLDKEGKSKTAEVKTTADSTKKKIENQEMMIKKLQAAVQEIGNINKRLQVVEQKNETNVIGFQKKLDNVKE